jgi:hypothetical protein
MAMNDDAIGCNPALIPYLDKDEDIIAAQNHFSEAMVEIKVMRGPSGGLAFITPIHYAALPARIISCRSAGVLSGASWERPDVRLRTIWSILGYWNQEQNVHASRRGPCESISGPCVSWQYR